MKMRKMIILAALVSILTLAVASQAAVAAAPKISFNEVYWELGTQPQGISVYHDIIITNTGDAPLTVKDVDPPCGCTIVDRGQYPLVLAPGESHTVNVSFQTGTYSGLITRNVAVSSDDPTAPVSQLTFTTNVVPYYTVTSTVSFPKIGLSSCFDKNANARYFLGRSVTFILSMCSFCLFQS